MKNKNLDRAKKSIKGASLVEFGLMVGLVSVLSISAILQLGDEVEATFEVAAVSLASTPNASSTPSAFRAPSGESCLNDLNMGESCLGLTYAAVFAGEKIFVEDGDDFSGITWSQDVTATNLDQYHISGSTLTDQILGMSGTVYNAAQACRSKGPEWFLPSRDEILALRDNYATNGLQSTFNPVWYWTANSPRDIHFNATALTMMDPNAARNAYRDKRNTASIRCFRHI